MPRTFSRGKRYSATDLAIRLPRHMPEEQTNLYLATIRQLHCPEPALIEQDIFDQLNQIRKGLRDLFNHIVAFHLDTAITRTDRENLVDFDDGVRNVVQRLNEHNRDLGDLLV